MDAKSRTVKREDNDLLKRRGGEVLLHMHSTTLNYTDLDFDPDLDFDGIHCTPTYSNPMAQFHPSRVIATGPQKARQPYVSSHRHCRRHRHLTSNLGLAGVSDCDGVRKSRIFKLVGADTF
jgi:hypothetical protein